MAGKPDIEIVRDYIGRKQFGPQDRLPAERMLADELRMTRSRLRTCLAKLEREGLIWRHVGQGTFLGSRPLTPDVGTWARMNGQEVETSPSEILEARLALEPQIAYLAAQRASGQDIDAVEKVIEKAHGSITWGEWSAIDREFHLCLARAAGNRLLLDLLGRIQASQTSRSWGTLSEHPSVIARRDEATAEHARLIVAIRARNPQESATLMRRHLEEVRTSILGRGAAF